MYIFGPVTPDEVERLDILESDETLDSVLRFKRDDPSGPTTAPPPPISDPPPN